MTIRDERVGDQHQIERLICAAFANHPHSNQNEHVIVNKLRDGNALTLSLVAEEGGEIAGHIVFSPVLIDGTSHTWHGLGPVSVRPELQRGGIGSKLIIDGLERLRKLRSNGCVVLGEPEFYQRFGFRSDARLWLDGVPAEFFLILPFGVNVPAGRVDYHAAFVADANGPSSSIV